jgi:hypothetical protein
VLRVSLLKPEHGRPETYLPVFRCKLDGKVQFKVGLVHHHNVVGSRRNTVFLVSIKDDGPECRKALSQ